jgi:hypothetical protein
MNKFLAIFIIILGLSFSLLAQEHSNPQPSSTPSTPRGTAADTVGWVTFTSDAGHFSVLMPEIPEVKIEKTESEHGPYTTTLCILRHTPNVYLIGWVDYDPNFNFNLRAELEANRDNFIKGIEAKLLTSQDTTIDGYSVIEFAAETSDRIFRSRVYMVGRRPYQIVIGSPKGEDDSFKRNRFFNSFTINKRKTTNTTSIPTTTTRPIPKLITSSATR